MSTTMGIVVHPPSLEECPLGRTATAWTGTNACGNGPAAAPRGNCSPQRRSRRVPTRGTGLGEVGLWETMEPSRDQPRRSPRPLCRAGRRAAAPWHAPSRLLVADHKRRRTACGRGTVFPQQLMGKRGSRMVGVLATAKRTGVRWFLLVSAEQWECPRRRRGVRGPGGTRAVGLRPWVRTVRGRGGNNSRHFRRCAGTSREPSPRSSRQRGTTAGPEKACLARVRVRDYLSHLARC